MVTLNMPLVSSNEASKSKASNPYEPKDNVFYTHGSV